MCGLPVPAGERLCRWPFGARAGDGHEGVPWASHSLAFMTEPVELQRRRSTNPRRLPGPRQACVAEGAPPSYVHLPSGQRAAQGLPHQHKLRCYPGAPVSSPKRSVSLQTREIAGGNRSLFRGWDSADLAKQAEGVPVHPFFDELAVSDPAQELALDVHLLAGRRGALQFPAVYATQ